MVSLIFAFFTSFIATILIIRTQKLHGRISADHQLDGPQKFHMHAVPRIGGLAIGLGILIAIAVHQQQADAFTTQITLLFCTLPTFLIGLLEDLTKKISVRLRLIFTALSALMAVLLLDAQISSVAIPYIDYLLSFSIISTLFTVFAITGLANAYNIIDGFNGLSSMVGIISLAAIGYISISFNDSLIIFLSFSMMASIFGFFIWNYPRGLIFLGDGGAYFIGFWVATLSILIICRHSEISPWFALLINAYPISETLFTIYRRKVHQGKCPGHPDGIHFHSLIFRRVVNSVSPRNKLEWFSANAKTSPYLWVFCSFACMPAVVFWHSTPILIACFLFFCISYVILYKKVVTFKTPYWMKF
ncbi:MraY family glycosyltransferase [Polynucleobacter ibericus]|uniref:MraY family glycosyltransferase n=1 Tax=Polynucleobacter ibericus TaxID=1819725 RepID=UPI001BFDD056|nr:glycosyltransferase [Polynucleobacter ibericus]QWE08974.1 glycosyltransferase family 4 protein [Polynucleobacter ibericus]